MDNFRLLDEHIQHLFIAYLEGTASDEEILGLQQWLAQSEDNFSLFSQFRKNWLQAGQIQRYDVENAWNKTERRLPTRHVAAYKHLWVKWASCAAAVVLLFSVGYYWINASSDQALEVAGSVSIEPGSKKAILVLGTNEQVELNNYSQDSIFHGNATVKKEGNTLVYDESEQVPVAEEYNRLITPRGGEYSVVLSDGTKVWLNAESELKYPVHFSGSERKVYLKGEAYFAVTKQEGKAFIVCSDDARITVLGTEFNVRNYTNEMIATTLVKGSVVVAHEDEEYNLVPGQQAIISEDGIQVNQVETILYTGWKDGYFVFQDQTLDDILKELSRWYDFTYFYQNNKLETFTLTAKLRKFDSVDEVLEVLKGTGRFDFMIKGKTITVVSK